MMPLQAADGRTRRGAILRWAVVWIVAAWLFAFPLQGRAPPEIPSMTDARGAPQQGPRSVDPDTLLRAAVALAQAGELDGAARILVGALDRWPDHPELLAGLAGVRLRQERLAEAEALAEHLTRVDPGAGRGWELLAASRYLQDDTRGALRAWSRHRSPVVRRVDVRVLAHDGPRATDAGTDPTRLTGIPLGRPLTMEELIRGERRLGDLPAGSRTRLGYRALPDGDVALEGTVVLGTRNPFARSGLVAHGLRLLVGRIQIVSSDPLGRLERWELSGRIEGTLHSAGLTLAQPAPLNSGVWAWTVEYGSGSYASAGRDAPFTERRTGVEWSHSDWVTASLRGSVQGRIDVRPGRGTFAGAGLGWTLRSSTGRGAVHLKGMAWTKMAGSPDGIPNPSSGFGRIALDAALRLTDSTGTGAPSGLHLRGGVMTVSAGIPADLRPRIGAGGNTGILMRARSDLDDRGVVRPFVPGRTWAHGGVEFLRPVVSVGVVGIGVAAFVDGVRVLGGTSGSADAVGRRGAVHLGVGTRIRVPVVAGWLRADWGIDPVDGASTISAAWVSGVSS